MKLLRILYYVVRKADCAWALREIDPLHPDVPKLVVQKQKWVDLLRSEMP